MDGDSRPTQEQIEAAKAVLRAAKGATETTREVFVVRGSTDAETAQNALARKTGYKIVKHTLPAARKVLTVSLKRITLAEEMDCQLVQAHPFNHQPVAFSTLDKARAAIADSLERRRSAQARSIERDVARLEEERATHRDFCDSLPALLSFAEAMEAEEAK